MDTSITSSAANGERVCDTCLIKKIKCNRQKPKCSRCIENDRECTYTTKRRKPGPVKGLSPTRRRISLSSGSNRQYVTISSNIVTTRSHVEPPGLDDNPFPAPHPGTTSMSPHDSTSNDARSTLASSWKGYRMIDVQSETSMGSFSVDQFGLSKESELDLLSEYFESIQPLYPLFRKQDLSNQYNAGQIPQAVLSSIFAVTAALSTSAEIMMRGPRSIGEHYAALTREACAPLCMSDVPATINDLRALFLLALYEFRTSPNRRAWATAGHLVRLAYHYGLHQVDHGANCSFYEEGVTSSEDLESWRYLWWSIYVLDTYCNSTASTPSNIDLDSLCTALPVGSVEGWTNGVEILTTNRSYLHGDMEDLLSLLKRASSEWLRAGEAQTSIDSNFVIRIIITSQMREVFHLRRAISQNPAGKFDRKCQLVLNHLASTRLALPASYQDPQRRVSQGEQKHDHAIRLVNLLELRISHIPFTTTASLGNDYQDESWLSNWDFLIELVDDIMHIVRNWNPSMRTVTDPSVCYIIFIAMVLIHMESKLEPSRTRTARAEEDSRSSWQLLYLFLQQLGNQWLLPKALIAAVEKFRVAASGPITMSDAYHISKSLQRPLTFQSRREANAHTLGIDHCMSFPFPVISFDSNGLYDWLGTFDQSEITFE